MYQWSSELESIIGGFKGRLKVRPAELSEHTKEVVRESIDLFQRAIGLDCDEKRLYEVVEFLQKFIITVNSLMPKGEPLRLAVKMPLDSPRIEIRLVKAIYAPDDGDLPVIDDSHPVEEAGKCLAIVYLIRFFPVKH